MYDGARAQIIVVKNGEVAHVEQLTRDRVTQWIEFVRDEKSGWIDQWWTVNNAAEAQ